MQAHVTGKIMIVFGMQIFIAFAFLWDYRKLNKFQPIDVSMTLVRILFAILIQKQVLSEMHKAVKTLVFLKRMKGNRQNHYNREICIMIISFQIVNPIFVCFVSVLYLAQEKDFFGMIKGYVAMGFFLNIDDLFSEIYPPELKKQPDIVNDEAGLTMSKDTNTNKRVLRRLCNRKSIFKASMWCTTLLDLFINFWVWFLTNFVIIVFSYFAPLASAVIQICVYSIS